MFAAVVLQTDALAVPAVGSFTVSTSISLSLALERADSVVDAEGVLLGADPFLGALTIGEVGVAFSGESADALARGLAESVAQPAS